MSPAAGPLGQVLSKNCSTEVANTVDWAILSRLDPPWTTLSSDVRWVGHQSAVYCFGRKRKMETEYATSGETQMGVRRQDCRSLLETGSGAAEAGTDFVAAAAGCRMRAAAGTVVAGRNRFFPKWTSCGRK